MARGIKSHYVLRNVVLYHLRKILLKCLVISHLQYSAGLLSSISSNLLVTLERQLNWALKACYFHRFINSSLSIKINNYILPIKQLLEYRTAQYVKQHLTYKKPALLRITGLIGFTDIQERKPFFLKRVQKHHGWTKVSSEEAHNSIIVFKKAEKGMEQTAGLKKFFNNYFFKQFQKDQMGIIVSNVSWKIFKLNYRFICEFVYSHCELRICLFY